MGILGILPRRAEIRVSQGLTRRHEATKKIRCRNGSPLPFQSDPPITRIEKNGQGRLAERTQDSGANAPSPPNQILPQRRRDAEEGILGILGILPRRAEIRVSQGLTRRHEATKKIRCRNGSPLPFQSDPPITQIEKNGRGGSPSGPKIQARTRRPPQTNSSRRGAGTQRREFWEYSEFCLAALPLFMKSSRQYWDGLD